jgi:hypothetical protein
MPELETYKKIALLPDELKKEVDDFVDFLLAKKNNKAKKRKPGLAKGLIRMKDDFDKPLKDFNDYMFE